MELTKEQKLFKDIIEKAWDDTEFKNQLIENPQKAIEESFGQEIKFKADKKVVFTDQTDEAITYINIPAKPNFDDVELSETALEKVAGGSWPTFFTGLSQIFNIGDINDHNRYDQSNYWA